MIVKGINILQKEKKKFFGLCTPRPNECVPKQQKIFNQPTTTTTIIRSHCALRQPPDHLPTCCCSCCSLSLTHIMTGENFFFFFFVASTYHHQVAFSKSFTSVYNKLLYNCIAWWITDIPQLSRSVFPPLVCWKDQQINKKNLMM